MINVSLVEYICANNGYSPYFIKASNSLFPINEINKRLKKRAASKN